MSEDKSKHAVNAWTYLGIAAAVVIFGWGWWCLEHFTGWRITSSSGSGPKEPLHFLFPLIGTVVVPLGAVFMWKRAAGIATHGVAVTARVIDFGLRDRASELQNVEFEYEFEGTTYKKKKSISSATADGLEQGGPLEIIVDKRKPSRILVK